ncbi:MAG: R3H domain-containing nucleic acid-binding protein [Deltaproteobacteria bacterium]|nr:R3H domain-containing nucleic acid-binding protein [Deltaproteobacteria bacterium]
MDLKEFSGKTVAEALEKAEAYYGLTKDDLKVKVVADEASGQYSIGMERRAVIVARPTPEAEGRATIAPPPPAPAYERPTRSGRPERGGARSDRRERPGRPARSQGGRDERSAPAREAAGEALYAPQRAAEGPGAAERGPSTESSKRARAILEGLLALLPLEGDVEVQDCESPDVIELAVSSDSEGFLLGEGGEVLAALTYLLNRMVNKDLRNTKRIAIEAEGYRSDHVASLEHMAREQADKVRASGEAAQLEPMNSYDRRIVHLSLKGAPGIITESEGEGPYKRLVIRPAPKD